MPKIERIEGAPQEMKAAAYNIIRHFDIAKECPEVRMEHIRAMFGEYGIILAAFDLCIQYGLFTDGDKLQISMLLEQIEEGIKKWRSATRSPNREEWVQVWDGSQEAPVSDE